MRDRFKKSSFSYCHKSFNECLQSDFLTMKRASSRPHQLKEQLLQALDAQNNIHDMTTVLDVISSLENYPMSKEALVETRLGKLINDVRKRSADKDLVKRLKNLVRSWQGLVGQNEATAKELSGFANKVSSTPAERFLGSTQSLTENYSQNIFHNHLSHRAETSRGSEPGKAIHCPTNLRKSKIPVLANKVHSSSIKRPQQFRSLRTSLSKQHCRDDHNVIIRDQLQRHNAFANCSDTKGLFVALKQAQSACITSSIQHSHINIQQPSDEVSSTVKPTNMRTCEDKTTRIIRLDGRPADDSCKNTQLQADEHDTLTRKIKPISTNPFAKDCQKPTGREIQENEHLKQKIVSFQQTNWRGTSQSLIQNSFLTSERISMADDFELNENTCIKTHTFIPDFPVTDLPGVSREVSKRDLIRIRSQRWHGVNGCYDNRSNWYDWTQSITLHPYGDGRKLKILPYVGVDCRL